MAYFSWSRGHWSSWSPFGLGSDEREVHTSSFASSYWQPAHHGYARHDRDRDRRDDDDRDERDDRDDHDDRGGRDDDDGFGVFRIGSFRSDKLVGTSKNDVLLGLTGNDTLIGKGGNDVLFGGFGDDTVKGGRGDDFIAGGFGDDDLRGGGGDDILTGGSGDDDLRGGGGDDTLSGGSGDDDLRGGGGDDTLKGGSGDNTIDGGKGHDTAVFSGTLAEFEITQVAGVLTVVRLSNGDTTTVKNTETVLFDDAEIPLPLPEASEEITAELIGRATTSGAEILAHDPGAQRLFVTTGDTVEVLTIADPSNPVLDLAVDGDGVLEVIDDIIALDPAFEADDVTSVAVSNGLVAIAVSNDDGTMPGKVAFYDTDGNFITAVDVGILPDSVTFTPDGTRLLVANEGERVLDDNDNVIADPEGSVSIIDVSGGAVDQTDVKTIGFDGFNGDREALVEAGVRIFPDAETVAQDLEPEFISVSPDGTQAFVTLQEANAVAVIDLETEEFTEIQPLGVKDHSEKGNGLDTSDEDGGVFISTAPIVGLYQPDAIASYTVNGTTYYVTANEGDSRDIDESRIEDLTLDPDAFPDAAELQDAADLGRLQVSNIDGDTDGDGDFDQLFAFGGRSFSIYDEDGNQVFDSGDDFEQIIATELPPEFFNDQGVAGEFDNRSDNKGPEPEGVTIGQIGDEVYAFVGLERVGGIMIYNVTDPENASYVDYINTREDDISPEGLTFISAADSPTGDPLLAVAYEESETVSLYSIPLERDIAINEIRIDQPGIDNEEYFELTGTPGTFLDGFSYVVIGDGAGGSGVVEAAIDLSGTSIGEDGFFVAGEDGSGFESQFDLITGLNFENSDNVTHLLVKGFNGEVGDDLDTNDDGVLDIEPWAEVADSVALVETPGSGDQVYSDTEVGPDGPFVPAHVFRLPDGTGEYEIGSFAIRDDTPGAANGSFSGELTPIYAIQGAGHRSPFEGMVVLTSGIVTAVDDDGFYLQDASGDGNIATSDGIFISEDDPSVAVGDAVEVTGFVEELQFGTDLSVTRIVSADTAVTSTGNALPDTVVLGVDRSAPTDVIDDDGLTSFDPEDDAIDFYESLEGMRVEVNNPLAVSGTSRFDEVGLAANRGDESGDGILNAVVTETDGVVDFNPEILLTDDDLVREPDVTTGDTFAENPVGVLDYTFGAYKLQLTETPTVVPGGRQPETTELAGTDTELTVATYNVFNLDPGDGDPGGDPDQFDNLANSIVNNLAGPDIIVLQEVQDNNGATNNGVVDADQTLQELVDAIALAGGPSYAFADIDPVDGADGGQPGANIRVAFLYNPERVDIDEASLQRIEDPSFDEGGDGSAEQAAFEGTRKPLAGTFEFLPTGEDVTVVGVHLKSKSQDDALFGEVQPPVEVTLPQRVAQAEAVNAFVDGVLEDDPDANVVVAGDFNDFQFSDTVEAAMGLDEDKVLTNLVEELPPEDQYTFIFNGNSQVLDNILVSESLADDAEVDIVHANLDFGFPSPSTSDHDPIVARLDLTPEENELVIA